MNNLVQTLVIEHLYKTERKNKNPLKKIDRKKLIFSNWQDRIPDDIMKVLFNISAFYIGDMKSPRWIAMSRCLYKIATNIDNYITCKETIREKTFFLICPRPYKKEIIDRLNDCIFFRYKDVYQITDSTNPIEGWLDLDNNFMFFIDQTMWRHYLDFFIKIGGER